MQVADGIITIGSIEITFIQVGITLVFFVFMGVIGGEIARHKGHSQFLWLVLVSLLPVLILVVLTLQPKARKKAKVVPAQANKNGNNGKTAGKKA